MRLNGTLPSYRCDEHSAVVIEAIAALFMVLVIIVTVSVVYYAKKK